MDNSSIEVYYEEDENGEWYTAIINNMVYQFNNTPSHPQKGFGQFIGTINENGLTRDALGEQIEIENCPENIVEAIKERTN